MYPENESPKLTTKTIVWSVIDAGEPTQRVIFNAVFCTSFGSVMGSSIPRSRAVLTTGQAAFSGILRIMQAGHAYLVEGSEDALASVLALVEEQGIKTRGNPDVYVRSYRQFGVGEAREISERTSTTAVGLRRVFIIVTPTMTVEAQNALLKTLEEPAGDTLFYIVVPAPGTLVPTLRSRMQTLTLPYMVAKDALVDAKTFITSKPEKRIEMLKPLLEKDEDDKRDMSSILVFLSALERELSKSAPKSRAGIEAVYRARRYAGDKGSLIKPLLEQVALLVQ